MIQKAVGNKGICAYNEAYATLVDQPALLASDFDNMMCVVQQEAVIFSAIMAVKMITVPAIPHCFIANTFECIAVVAPPSFFCPSYRKVSLAKSLDGCRE